MNKAMHNVALGILTTVVSGLIFSVLSFFSNEFPKTKYKINLNSNKIESHDEYLKRIDRRMERVDDKTQRILEYIVNGKKN